MPALTTLPIVINPGDPNHIEHHEDLHALYNGLTIADGLSNRPAAGNEGAYYIASWAGTTITRLYRDNGTDWVPVNDPFGVFNPLDYGADPTAATDSKAAFDAAIAAANAVLITGLPYESGSVEGGVVEVWAGQYKCSASVTFPAQSQITMRGVAGSADRFLACPVIAFTTGGFVEEESQSNLVSMENLVIVGVTAPAFTCRSATATSAGPGIFRNVYFRSTGSGVAALEMSNVFNGNFYNCTFRSPNSSTPSVLIESGATFGFGTQGWMFRFHECLFEENGIRWDCNGTHSTVPGIGFGIYDCITENFDAGCSLLHVRNTHATQSFSWYGVEVLNTDHYDAADPSHIVTIETLGSGQLAAKKIHLRGVGIGGSGKYVRCVETGGGAAGLDFILIEGTNAQNDSVTFGTPGSGVGVMFQESGSGWRFLGNAHTNPGKAISGRRQDDNNDGFTLDARGFLRRGTGGSSQCDIAFATNAGTPESAITSDVGGIVQDRTNACVWIKKTGAGSTGWRKIPAIGNDALMDNAAGSSFIDWSRVQVVFVGNGGAVTLTTKGAASQTVSHQEWVDNSSNILSRVNKGGYFMTRKTAAPADGDLANSELAFWLDATPGATLAMFKAKDSGGTVRSGSVALA